MEIISYVMSGNLTHQDNMGNVATIEAGETQRMTAGRGILHSESNDSDRPVHMFQMWVFPDQVNLDPEYEQRAFSADRKRNNLLLLASPDGEGQSLKIHQDARLYASILEPGAKVEFANGNDRHQWLQVARGRLTVNDLTLNAGDGLAVSHESRLAITAGNDEAEFLMFDLA